MKKLELLLNVLLRMVFGIIGIYAFNTILDVMKIKATVGFNIATIATVGILGVPGFLLLYGIMLFNAS